MAANRGRPTIEVLREDYADLMQERAELQATVAKLREHLKVGAHVLADTAVHEQGARQQTAEHKLGALEAWLFGLALSVGAHDAVAVLEKGKGRRLVATGSSLAGAREIAGLSPDVERELARLRRIAGR